MIVIIYNIIQLRFQGKVNGYNCTSGGESFHKCVVLIKNENLNTLILEEGIG